MTTAEILRKMAERLKRLESCNFNICMWLRQNDCGTVGCIIGLCHDLIPGLEMKRVEDDSDMFYPSYNHEGVEEEGFTAIGFALNLHPDDVKQLFSPYTYRRRGTKTVKENAIERLLSYADRLEQK